MTNIKIQFINARKKSKKITATVIEYGYEKGPLRNDYTMLYYPYVKLDLPDIEYRKIKLRYADNKNKPFKIGEKIDVFWYGNDLAYWNTYDKGFSKLLPEKWTFWK